MTNPVGYLCYGVDGQRLVRIALLIGAVAPGYEYVCFLLLHDGLRTRAWLGEGAGFFVSDALAGGIGFVVSFAAGWYLGYPAIRFVSRIICCVFAPKVPVELWDSVTDRSLVVLPAAATLGALTWLVYSIGRFGGWPDDVVFGTVANLIGAWCCLTLLTGWLKLWRRCRIAGEPGLAGCTAVRAM
jgi:hypothetical protein